MSLLYLHSKFLFKLFLNLIINIGSFLNLLGLKSLSFTIVSLKIYIKVSVQFKSIIVSLFNSIEKKSCYNKVETY